MTAFGRDASPFPPVEPLAVRPAWPALFACECPGSSVARGADGDVEGFHERADGIRLPCHTFCAEKLYGREPEIDTLLAAFDRVVAQGTPELVLVSGYSGVGKSSVVNELHKVLVPPRGLFAGGKFDQYKRDIPYATLAQAFQTLVRQILVKSEAEVRQWRSALSEEVGPNGQLIVGLAPRSSSSSGNNRPFRTCRRKIRSAGSKWCSGDSSASSLGRSTRSPCFSTICNGWTRPRLN